ncbi:MAG: outer membrane lipoprotein-sorting protein [Bdellovibrionota bacterium]
MKLATGMFGFLLAFQAFAASPTPDEARGVIQQLIDQTQASKEEFRVTMKLLDAAGHERAPKRIFTTLSDSADKEHLKMLFTFQEPPNVKGTKILTIKAGDDSGQWIYLPSAKRVTRINSSDDDSDVLDSDLSYADIKGESLDDFDYRMSNEQFLKYAERECGGQAWAVAALPKKSGAYSKRILSIDRTKLVLCGVVFYDKSGKIIKTISNKEFRQVGGSHWRPAMSVVTTLGPGGKATGKTEMTYYGWKFGIPIEETQFSPSNLGQ